MAQTVMAAAPVLDLPTPPVPAAPAIPNPNGSTYVSVTLSGVPAGQDIVNGAYDAWCIDYYGALTATNFTTYNSYGGVNGNTNPAMPASVLLNGQMAWNEVNWLINHKMGNNNDEPGATPTEVQDAIWTLLDPYYPAASTNDAVTKVLVTDAQVNGASFVPGPGQFIAVLLYYDGILPSGTPSVQDLIIQLRVGGTIGDFVWLDSNHNGLQDQGEPGINGLTVQLYQGSVLLATTVTANAPAGYQYPGPTPAGYYQFTGLQPGSYTVVIPNNQSPLSGTGPTLAFQGTNVLIDSNGQESTVPGTSTPAVTASVTLPDNNQAPNSLVDQTIDFGFYPVQPISLQCPSGTAQQGVSYNSALIAAGGVAPYTYSISSGNLPNGLTLNASTGAITGIPTTAGAFSFTAKVVDATGTAAGTTTTSCTITVIAPIALACPKATAQVGVLYSSSLVATGGVAPYTYSISSGNLPTGLTLNASTGAITGTPATAGTFSFTAKVVDSTGTAAGTTTTSCTIVVSPPPVTLACPSATAQVGVAYSSALVAGGGVPPYTFSIASGNLPAGLNLNASTGAITGTPTTAGTYSFTAKVVDSTGTAATANCTITVVAPVTLTCPSATAQVGVAYKSSLVAAGGVPPYTYSIISGNLPAGLALNASTGAITGTPTTPGAFSFTAKVVDSTGTSAGTATTSCTITVSPAPITLACPAGTAQVNVAFSSSLVAAGGVAPYTYSITSGNLPAGLALNASTGAITGTPTTAGTFSFTAKVVDSTGTAAGTTTASCTITVIPPPITLTCPASTAQVGVAYSSSLTAGGGVPPYTFSISSGNLPAGLTLNASTGAITGTPTTAGTFSFTAKVVDSTGKAVGTTTANCTITVNPPPTATCVVITAVQGSPITPVTLVGSGGAGGPYTFTATGLPAGLSISTSGTISGTPTVSGTFAYTVTIADKNGNMGTINCSVTVKPPLSLICPAGTAQVSVPYSSSLVASGGIAPYTYSISSGNLPAGLTLNASTGAITGTPTTAGTYSFTAKVVDSTGTAAGTTTASCTITVIPPPVTLTCPASTAQVGVAYSSSLTAGGGVPPYTFSISSGNLPAGLTLNASTGAITGTPTTAGTFSFTATVVDSTGKAAGTTTANCTITVNPPPTATCAVITAVQGSPITPVTLVGSGGAGGPYTFTATGLPAGLIISTSGTISGTPTVSGTFSYTVTVADKNGNKGTINCSVTVNPPPTSTCVVINAVQGVAIAPVTLVGSGGTGGPYTFTATGLPAGLTISSAGTISGTPTVSGTFPYTVTIADKNGNKGTINCSVTVNPAPTTTCVVINAVQGVAITSVTLVGSGGAGGPYTFTATGLPAGLTISVGGTISGTPTVSGTFAYTVTVTDVAGNKGTVNCSVTVNGPPTATCVVINAVQGVAISPVTLVGSGGAGGPYTFTATGLPAGLTISSAGTISGTPTVSGTFTYTVTITDKSGNKGTINCSVTVNSPPTTSCVVINAVQGVAITPVTLVGSGGAGGPYTFMATGLPAGLTISAGGTISGTPTVSGTFAYTVTVTDVAGNKGTVNCSVTVNGPPTATCVVINAVQGVAISPVTLVGSGGAGGPYTFSATGLPAGLSISTSGTISGTPTVSGTFTYTVTITDKSGNKGTVNCSVTVNSPPTASCVVINAVQGVAITPVTLVGSGGAGAPYTFSATGLPAGLTISAGGTISGTPTVSGTFAYTVTVTDVAGNKGTVNCSVTVNSPPTTSCVVINAVQGVAITSVTLVGSGGAGGPYTFTATGLPAGLTISAGGTISGTPTVSGTFSYTVTITDKSGNKGTVNCSVTVNPPPTTSCVVINAVQGVAITSVTLVGSGGAGGPYTFTATGLPAGLTISSSGTISGTPTVSGTFAYTVTVTDSAGNKGTVNCSVTVNSPPTASCVVINAVQGVAITPVTLVGSGGAGGPYTFSATGLPAGLSISTSGTISGTPTVTGTFTYTVTITDKSGNKGTVNCSVTVNSPPTTSCVVINAVQGVAITSVTLVGSGGAGGPYTFTATGLPAGLSISTSGTISGTPTVSGTFAYTVTVTDSAGNKGTVNCSVTVNPPPTASCVVINAVQGFAITPVNLVGSGGAGGPYTFSATGLPAGLSISTSGTISGTPTVSGTFSYTVTITDKSGNKGTVNCSVTVNSPPTATCAVITAVQGSPITPVTLAGSGGAGGPYTFTATGLPAGLSISSSGTISGTPTVSGTFAYTVTVTDSAGNKGTVNCSVTVNPPPTTSCVVINAVLGVAITPVTLVGSGGAGGPYTFTATGLPAGLTISAGGTISGTPTVFGTFPYTVTITDKNGNKGTVNCSVTVNPPPITLACAGATAQVGVPYSSSLIAAGGVAPYTYSISSGNLPAGLTLNASTGAITGTPTAAGTFSFTAKVVDSTGTVAGTAATSCTIIVTTPCVIPASQTIISGTSWNKFNTQGSPNYVWIHAHIGRPSGLSTTTKTFVDFTGVTFSVNGIQYPMPDGLLVFDPAAPSTPSTMFDTTFAPNGRWTTTVNPNNLSDEIFFVGNAVLVDANISGGGQANFSFTTNSTDTSLAFSWQWSAAVFTYWPVVSGNPPSSGNNAALILPYHNSDHAGTPENTTVQHSLIQGPRGGGGSNYTGSWSATGQGTCVGNSH